MQYKESNLLGAPFRGGSLAWASPTQLLLPLGSRVALTDLKLSESNTLPGQHSGYVARMAVSPDGTLMLSVDTKGRALLFNVRRRRLLHRLRFKGPVSAIKFSPDGSMFAAGVGKLVQVWRTPGYRRQFCAFHLLKTFVAQDTVTCLDWSPDNDWIIAGTRDLVCKLFCVHRLPAYHPVTLSGHRDPIVGVYFTKDDSSLNSVTGAYSVSRDGALFHWQFQQASPEVLASLEALAAGGSEEPEVVADTVRIAGSKTNGTNFSKDDADDDFTVVLNPEDEENVNKGKKRKMRLIEKARKKKLRRKREEAEDEGKATTTLDEETPGSGEEAVVTGKQEQDVSEQQERGFVDPLKAELQERKLSCSRLDKGRWELSKKHFFLQKTSVTSCSYHPRLNLLVAGFATGTFGLYQLPEFTCLHLLSISRDKITSAAFNETGNWLAFGCAKLGQLLVWEWRSETYVLKQQGHYFDVNCVAYSPDSQLLATGADDNKLKVWNNSTGFCFVTFTEHTNAVTAVLFLSGNRAVVSASLDGTVRAFDLMRYRNFRTFTTPAPTQFISLAADQSGEVICAGSLDTFQIYVWSMKTGRLLDMLSGHDGPVYGLAFSPTDELLASSSWDKSVRLWDVFKGKGGIETFSHTHEVLALAYRPDGKQLACSTLDGSIHLWDPLEGVLTFTIEGRRDIAGGRLMSDRRTAANSSSGKAFNTIAYTADGRYLLAGGTSKYICLYDVSEQVLLRRFQISYDMSLDGVRDMLNSKNMTDAGPLDMIDDDDSDDERFDFMGKGQGLPGTAKKNTRTSVRTKCLQISPTGRSWAAATCEGVLVFSMDDDLIFDPTDLDVDVTPEFIEEAMLNKQHARAVVLSLRLKEISIIRRSIEAVPLNDISTVARFIPLTYLGTLLGAINGFLESTPHLEFLLEWCQEICVAHGRAILAKNKQLLPLLRSLQKSLTRLHEDLSSVCSANQYLLQYVCSAPAVAPDLPQLRLTSQ
ncbi:periodic tryptophan protein 2 [Marchantia polymorpha subsp. ruderalis]|uniref:Small-subunit processome Utp12 domain-containing protein n=2 Tax=Marchantia polymorpha TaxID=3197 RepID=A0A176W9Y4_MARPO|nr:hypothetical protein AXG93_773s1370 [Marchantia polymorpha subsp. ruderalis]PTQ50076.1 hypothetical protein MARPO_0001s0129 [Marchantia polymorpha]BBM99000.1 hypothetical protein Mp_1g17900 [Marchantia polymorpha subsp. ruderalis]|eukprot:PTQ50076.1 hypothetical protein MARPO_0001s0129 [Marchantia polymorpha]